MLNKFNKILSLLDRYIAIIDSMPWDDDELAHQYQKVWDLKAQKQISFDKEDKNIFGFSTSSEPFSFPIIPRLKVKPLHPNQFLDFLTLDFRKDSNADENLDSSNIDKQQKLLKKLIDQDTQKYFSVGEIKLMFSIFGMGFFNVIIKFLVDNSRTLLRSGRKDVILEVFQIFKELRALYETIGASEYCDIIFALHGIFEVIYQIFIDSLEF
ncbi:MAG: hypothetical protein ACTSWN_10525 [Promethearchaeota archaeon]